MWEEGCLHVFVYGITYFTGFLSITPPTNPKRFFPNESLDHRHGVFSPASGSRWGGATYFDLEGLAGAFVFSLLVEPFLRMFFVLLVILGYRFCESTFPLN